MCPQSRWSLVSCPTRLSSQNQRNMACDLLVGHHPNRDLHGLAGSHPQHQHQERRCCYWRSFGNWSKHGGPANYGQGVVKGALVWNSAGCWSGGENLAREEPGGDGGERWGLLGVLGWLGASFNLKIFKLGGPSSRGITFTHNSWLNWVFFSFLFFQKALPA